MMEKHNVCLMLLQETWTGTSSRESEFEGKPNGYLFLLKGNKKPIGKKGRNQCGYRFIISPFAQKAWIASGQEAIKLHHCNDSMTRIASIKLLFKRGNSKPLKLFFLSVYAPGSSYEQSYPYEDFISNLTDAVNECPKDHILILGETLIVS